MSFAGEILYCDQCPPVMAGKNLDKRVGERLELVVSNYSGTGVDIASCQACMTRYEVSYKVDKVQKITPTGARP